MTRENPEPTRAAEPHSAAPPVLSYGDPVTRRGILCDPRPDGVLITIPRPRLTWVAALVLLAAGAGILIALPRFGALAALSLTVTAILLLVAPNRIPRRLVRVPGVAVRDKPLRIELNAETLTLHDFDPGAELPDPVLPRDKIYEVKYVPHSGNVVVRAHGHELLEFRPVRDEHVLRWIVDVLNDALRGRHADAALPEHDTK